MNLAIMALGAFAILFVFLALTIALILVKKYKERK